MRPSRYKTSRQKACQQCSAAKAKCIREALTCTRCAAKGLQCVLPEEDRAGRRNEHSTNVNSPTSVSASSPYDGQPRILAPRPSEAASLQGGFVSQAPPVTMLTPASTPSSYTQVAHDEAIGELDFFNLELICSIDSDSISTRWLNPYVPMPGQTVKNYPTSVIAFIRRILRSYASVVIRGRGIPPFVHPVQLNLPVLNEKLSACLNLVRICDGAFAGSFDAAAEVLNREMNKIYSDHATYDESALLSAFQSHLIYLMVLYFNGEQRPDNGVLRTAMLQLQEIASLAARQGIMCLAEQQHVRPKWEAWIIAEAKRRTLYVMYMFDSLLLAEDNLPSFLASELYGLPAPASRRLWYADVRRDWETLYNVHLADWPTGALRIDELWPTPPEFDEASRGARRCRVDSWLEGLDEFGTMLYTVTSYTHGS